VTGRRRTRPRWHRARQPRTLRTRLVVASVVLIAVVCAVIGTVTTLALRSHLYEQPDGRLKEAAARAAHGFVPPDQNTDRDADRDAVGRKANDDNNIPQLNGESLTGAQTAAFGSVARDGAAHSVDIPGLGGYLARCETGGGTGPGGGEGTSSQISTWVEEDFEQVTAGSATFYDLTRPKS